MSLSFGHGTARRIEGKVLRPCSEQGLAPPRGLLNDLLRELDLRDTGRPTVQVVLAVTSTTRSPTRVACPEYRRNASLIVGSACRSRPIDTRLRTPDARAARIQWPCAVRRACKLGLLVRRT